MKGMSRLFNGLKYFLIVILLFPMVSCESWLDLGSEDRIMEKDLFSTRAGFMSALNGIYIDFLGRDLYGGTLNFRTFDIMAQYYDCDKDEHSYKNLITYDPSAKNGQVGSFWSRVYTLLVNVNTLIESCDAGRGVLDDQYYHVIKGEALALRALLHFELFKVFGPIYVLDPETECIPYTSSSDLVVRPLLKASEVAGLIMADFKAAEALLEEYDPVIKEGALYKDAGAGIPNDMTYRSMRLNYYAVKAYIARLSLYIGDKETALDYARQVIRETQEDNQWFPFITREAATTNLKWDRVYKSEILFGLYNLKRESVFEENFSNKLGEKVILCPTQDNIDLLYEENSKINDWRYTYHWMTLKDTEGNDKKFFVKYMAVDDTEGPDDNKVSQGYSYIVPLMRISEMYLIAAECTKDVTEAYAYINKVRAARGITGADQALGVMANVEAEFRREFIGEGQLFWFYKRQNRAEIPSGRNYSEKVNMEKSFYLFDLPQSEKDKRGI